MNNKSNKQKQTNKKQTKPKQTNQTNKTHTQTKPKKDISLNDISYKYMPISVFHRNER